MCGWKLMISAGFGSGQKRSCRTTVFGGMLRSAAACSGFSSTSAPVGIDGSSIDSLCPARSSRSSIRSRFSTQSLPTPVRMRCDVTTYFGTTPLG